MGPVQAILFVFEGRCPLTNNRSEEVGNVLLRREGLQGISPLRITITPQQTMHQLAAYVQPLKEVVPTAVTDQAQSFYSNTPSGSWRITRVKGEDKGGKRGISEGFTSCHREKVNRKANMKIRVCFPVCIRRLSDEERQVVLLASKLCLLLVGVTLRFWGSYVVVAPQCLSVGRSVTSKE